MSDRVVSITDGALTTTVDNIEHIESQSLSLAENPKQAPWLAVLLAVAALQLRGCEVGRKYGSPVMQAAPAYKEEGNWKPRPTQ
jgi:hypothetical protein